MVLLEGVDAVVAIGGVLGGRGESGVTAPDGSQSRRPWGGPGTDRRKGTAGEALGGGRSGGSAWAGCWQVFKWGLDQYVLLFQGSSRPCESQAFIVFCFSPELGNGIKNVIGEEVVGGENRESSTLTLSAPWCWGERAGAFVGDCPFYLCLDLGPGSSELKTRRVVTWGPSYLQVLKLLLLFFEHLQLLQD